MNMKAIFTVTSSLIKQWLKKKISTLQPRLAELRWKFTISKIAKPDWDEFKFRCQRCRKVALEPDWDEFKFRCQRCRKVALEPDWDEFKFWCRRCRKVALAQTIFSSLSDLWRYSADSKIDHWKRTHWKG